MTSPINPSSLGWKKWIIGARPRTLPAAVVPVLVGVACASGAPSPIWWRGVVAGLVSLALQIGVNYANDYSDGVKGTDAVRVGPLRLVGSGAATASHVKRAAFIMFGIAACAGLVLALMTSLWLVLVGALAIIAAWTYTGGPRPYGYAGWGEVFVFIFFGVVATTGSQFVVAEEFTWAGLVASIAVGCIACSLLVINNLRDIPGDTIAGKNTLAVKLGDANTRRFFALLVIVAALSICATAFLLSAYALFGLVGIVVLRPALEALARGAKGRDLIIVLGNVGRAQLVLGITFGAGIALSIVS
jgi:1,4-dihydroxy-2-naphthoate octaprenyltransferase